MIEMSNQLQYMLHQRICPLCRGTGYDKELVTGEVTCADCMGTGRDAKSDACMGCGGRGKKLYWRMKKKTCGRCYGSGTVRY